mgnify:CR=1 FL=1
MKNIIVTGSSSGLGEYICDAALLEGLNPIGLARTPANHSRFITFECDVSDHTQVKNTFKQIKKKNEPHVLINTAGIASMNLFLTTPPKKMQQIVNTNVLGTMYCCQEALKCFVRQKNRNLIINFSTIAVPLSLKGESVYVASKGAVESFSKTLARESADFNCNVNVIAPGPVDTKLISGIPDSKIQDIVNHQIINQKATKKDIWKLCKLLMLDEAKDITGEIINVKGA